jgi:hypothetical protein
VKFFSNCLTSAFETVPVLLLSSVSTVTAAAAAVAVAVAVVTFDQYTKGQWVLIQFERHTAPAASVDFLHTYSSCKHEVCTTKLAVPLQCAQHTQMHVCIFTQMHVFCILLCVLRIDSFLLLSRVATATSRFEACSTHARTINKQQLYSKRQHQPTRGCYICRL